MCKKCGRPLENEEIDQYLKPLLKKVSEKSGKIALLDNPELYIASLAVSGVMEKLHVLAEQIAESDMSETEKIVKDGEAFFSSTGLIADIIERYHTNPASMLAGEKKI